MSVGFVGAALSPKQRKALADAGVRIVDAKRADVVVYVGPRPPARAPRGPWVWAATRFSPSLDGSSASANSTSLVSRAGARAGSSATAQRERETTPNAATSDSRAASIAPHAATSDSRAASIAPNAATSDSRATSSASIAPEDATLAILAGAYDCIPLDDAFAPTLARRLAEMSVRSDRGEAPPEFVARSAAARRLLVDLDLAARTSMPVLLTGETGTGKDLAAKHLHARSGRKGTFVPINCAAIPNDLIEGELFGYVKGAFSGAVADYDGQLRAAAGGTVYLDEVDDTPITLQVKLLRVLEDHVVSRLGENTWRQVDFRVIAASNRDLEAMVARGELGADLYQRLAIVRIELPPLRQRGDDLPELAAHLVARFYREEPSAPHRVTTITPTAMDALRRYPWPGNVRELRNVLYQALVGKRAGAELLLSDLPPRILKTDRSAKPTGLVDRDAIAKLIDAGQMNLRAIRDDLERTALELALARANGSATKAARMLGEVGRGSSTDPAGTVRAMRRRFGV